MRLGSFIQLANVKAKEVESSIKEKTQKEVQDVSTSNKQSKDDHGDQSLQMTNVGKKMPLLLNLVAYPQVVPRLTLLLRECHSHRRCVLAI